MAEKREHETLFTSKLAETSREQSSNKKQHHLRGDNHHSLDFGIDVPWKQPAGTGIPVL